MKCAMCYNREQGTHGEVKKEWSRDWGMYIPSCRKHAETDIIDADYEEITEIGTFKSVETGKNVKVYADKNGLLTMQYHTNLKK